MISMVFNVECCLEGREKLSVYMKKEITKYCNRMVDLSEGKTIHSLKHKSHSSNVVQLL